jgi:hypothetical protein
MNSMIENAQIASFEIDGLEMDVLPGGASEPVIHIGAVIVVIGLLYATPAY